MKYCEMHNSSLALKHYLNTGEVSEILRLSFELKHWDSLSLFLINSRNAESWSLALSRETADLLFAKVVENANSFPDTESASCLIKVLAGKDDQKSLIKIMSAWLETNPKLRSSRSLQTLYLINVIKVPKYQHCAILIYF